MKSLLSITIKGLFKKIRNAFRHLSELDRDPVCQEAMVKSNLHSVIATSLVPIVIGIAGSLGNLANNATTPVISSQSPYLIYILLLVFNVPVQLTAALISRGKLKAGTEWTHWLINIHIIMNMVLAAMTIYSTQTGSSFYFETVLIISPLAMLPVYRFKMGIVTFLGTGLLLAAIIKLSGVYLGWQDQYDIIIFFAFCIVIASVRHSWFVSRYRLDHQLTEMNALLQEKSRTDGLTGLRNRNALEEDISLFTNRQISIAMMDLDFFKEVNDRSGHLAGDEILRDLAEDIKKAFENRAFCYRYGGDEFMILDSEDSPEEFTDRLKSIQEELKKRSRTATIGYSFGFVQGEREIRTLLADADNNLYLQKANKRGGLRGGAFVKAGSRIDYREKLKVTDTMTGFLTYDAFIRKLDERRLTRQETLICLDVDRLEQFNREFGYQEGDRLLVRTADLIREEFPDCPAARWDDQFAVLTGSGDYEKRILQIQNAIGLQNRNSYVILRAGILRASYELSGMNARTRIDMAKYACDSLRGQSSVQICYYDRELDRKRKNKSFVQNHFKEALEKGSIIPFFQPIISASDGKTAGFEALARWIDEESGLISPGAFIPVLEDSMESYLLDFYILRAVCKKIKNSGVEKKGLFVSVNFSRTDFYVCDVPERIESIVREYGTDRSSLRIEVTESAFTEDPHIRSSLQKLKDMGYQVWIDDFGSGMSSLNTLQSYTVDTVKIDLAFLKRSESNPKSLIIIKEIIRMCHAIGAKALIEGVETEQQRDFVVNNGIDLIQGYYYSRPLPAEDLEEF